MIKADKENIKSVKITWTFADEFSKELLKLYDINLDKTFDEKELAIIQSYLIDYLKDKDGQYLVRVLTALEDMDVQNNKNIISYLYKLKLIYDSLDDNAMIRFDFQVAPFDGDLFQIQESYNAKKNDNQ
jgi:hypothetical protein